MSQPLSRVAWLSCLACFALTGCGVQFDRADLVILNAAEPESLDPAIVTGQPEGRVVNTLFEGLTDFDEHGKTVPGVAEHWEITEQGRRYLFHLRPEARWSNGDPVTAHDFVASWRRTLSPETASAYSYLLYCIEGAEAFALVQENQEWAGDWSQVGVRALSDHQLEVVLAEATPYFIDLCAFTTLRPVHVPSVEEHGEHWLRPGNLISNGAYQLKAWRINDRVRVEKNPHYWDAENVAMTTVDFLPTNQAMAAFNLYDTGEADLMLDKGLAPMMFLHRLRERPDFHSAPILATYFLRFNVTQPPFDDARVRKALALAIDKSSITERITRAGEPATDVFVPPGTGRDYQPPQGLGYDPDLARQLLAEAGYPEGRGFPRVSYLYNPSDLNEAVFVELQSMLRRELGIDIVQAKQEWKVYLNSMESLNYNIARSSWVGDYNDPNTFLDLFVTGGGNNRTGWGHPDYDQAIQQAAAALEPEERNTWFQRAEQILVTEAVPVVPLYFFVGILFYDADRLGGMHPNLLDEHPVRRMYWK
ncbi:MAG: peptide ABC transporter substrate-binding protein [Verrucomicrobiales bacterium]